MIYLIEFNIITITKHFIIIISIIIIIIIIHNYSLLFY